MRTAILLLGAGLTSLLTGCAGFVVVDDPRPPVVVASPAPVVTVDVVDYWTDGARYYYLDTSTSLYFWWNSGTRVYCDRGWRPLPHWHHHDHYWRDRDRGHGGWRGHDHRPVVRPPVHRPPTVRPPVNRPPSHNPPRGGHGGNDGRGGRGGNDGHGHGRGR